MPDTMWYIPWPWRDGCPAFLVVRAASAYEATALARAWVDSRPHREIKDRLAPLWGELAIVTGPVLDSEDETCTHRAQHEAEQAGNSDD